MFGSTYDLQHVIEVVEQRVPGCAVVLVGYSAGSALTGRMAGDLGQLCGRTREELEIGSQPGGEFAHNPAARAALAADPESFCWRGEGGRFRTPVVGNVSVSPSYCIDGGLERCEAMLVCKCVSADCC